MTERQAHILATLIREYVRTAEPVGSESLVGRFRLPYSAATVRAELSDLEDAGFLTHPHTSAGRVPTRSGYRHFVDHAVESRELSSQETARLEEDLRAAWLQQRRVARSMAKIVSEFTHALAVASVDGSEEFSEAGFAELLREPEVSMPDLLRDVARTLDALDRRLDELARQPMPEPRVYIGEENPLASARHVSVILSTGRLRSGEHVLFAVIGPTRMRYDRNLPLIEHITRMVEHSSWSEL
jgi:heat-inducible transcriptional repressor